MRTHILEGHHSDGRKYVACRRRPVPSSTLAVGRAYVLAGKHVDDVTCASCRRRYRLALDGGGGGG